MATPKARSIKPSVRSTRSATAPKKPNGRLSSSRSVRAPQALPGAEVNHKRRADELAALQTSLLEITAPRPLQDLLQTIVRRAVQLLGSQSGGLYLCDPERREVHCVVSYNTAQDYTGTMLKYGEGAAGIVAQTGKPLMIDDYRLWQKRAAAFEEKQPFSAVLSAPMIWDNQVTGVLHVLREVEGLPFTDSDLSLLVLFAGHAAIAVKNAQLFEEAQFEIHERKNAEHSLRASEQRLRALTEATSEGIVFHENGQVLDVNPAILAMFGLNSASDAIGHSLLDFVAPESRHLVLQQLKSAKTDAFEARALRSDGSTFPVEITRRLYEHQGRPIRVAALRDISERMRAQDRLRESEEQYRGLVAEIGEGIFVADQSGILTSASPTLAAILGVTDAASLLGRSFVEFVAPEMREQVSGYYRDAVQSGRTRESTVVDIIRSDGSAATVEVRSVPVVRDGKVAGARGILRDVTEVKRAADAVAAIERRFRALVEKAADAIALLSPDGTLLYDSPAAPGLLGYEAGSLLGKSMLTLVHPDDLPQVASVLERLLKETGATINTIFRFRHTDGRWLWFEATGTNLLNEPSVGALVINYRDVTDRVHAQEHLRFNEERYRQLFDSMLDGFALHEIICDSAGKPVDYRFLEINAAFERLTGLRRADVVGKTALEALPGLEHSWIERYGAVALTGQPAHFSNFSRDLGRYYDATAYCPKPGQFAVIFEDITERMQAEMDLQASKHELEQFFDVVPDLVAIASTDGYFKKLNKAWEQVLGFTPAELMAEPLENFIHPEDVESTRLEVARQLAGGTTANFVNRYRTRTGSYRWLEWDATPSPDGSMLNAAARDITDRNLAQEALLQRARELQTLYETSLEVGAQTTLDDLLNTIVQRAAAIVGTDMGALYLLEPDKQSIRLVVAHNLPQSFIGATLRLGEGISGKVAQTGKPMQVEDYQTWPGRSPVYDEVPLRRVLAIPLIADEEMVGVINIADATNPGTFPDDQVQLVGLFANQAATAVHSRRAQDALRASERQFRELLENAQLVAVLLDSAARVTFCNEFLLGLLGCEREDVIGQDWFERFVPPELNLREMFRDALQQGSIFHHFDNEIVTASGARRLIAWNNTLLRDPQGRVIGIASLGEDITDSKRAAAENAALLAIMQGAATTDGLHEFLELTRQALGAVLDAENLFVVFHHKETGLFEEVFAVDKYDAPMPPSRLEKGITSLVFRTGTPLRLSPASLDDLLERGLVEQVGARPASWIGAPLKTPSETIGVIAIQHYEDPERYSERDLSFLASVATQVALAIQRKQAQSEIVRLARFPAENPGPVLRLSAEGTLLYANSASADVLATWGCRVGDPIPDFWREYTNQALSSATASELTLEVPGKSYSAFVAPVPEQQYVNVYARDVTDRLLAEAALKDSEARFKGLFEDSPVALWEQDFSRVKNRLDALRQDGVKDLGQYLELHPEVVQECADLVEVLDVNKATRAVYGARRKADLLKGLGQVLDGSTLEDFRSELVSISAGKTQMNWEGLNRTLDGRLINVALDWSAVPGHEQSLSRVIVAATDITARVQAQTLQQAVYRIAAAAENAASLDELYGEIHETISAVMPAENFYITTYDAEHDVLRFPYFKDIADEPYIDGIAPGKGLTAYVLRTSKSLLCTQAVHDELERRGEVKLLGSPSAIWLGVPLIVEGKTIGAMVVQHYTDPNAYGEREQHMLEFVSTQIAVAIHRKQAEEALRESEGRLQALVASLDDVVIEYDALGTYLNVWARDESLLSQPAHEMVGLGVTDVMGEEKARPLLGAIQSVIATGKAERLEYELDVAGGARWFRARLSPIAGTESDTGAVSALIRDVTQVRVAEERLRREATLLESMQDAVIGAGAQGERLNAWNAGAEALYGWKADEILGKHGIDILGTEWAAGQEDEMFRQLAEQGRWRGEVTQLRKDGRRISVEVSAAELRDQNDQVNGWLSVNHDITSRRRAAEALRAQLEELQRWHAVTLQREDRILELKRQINEQLVKSGQPPRYASAETQQKQEN